MREIFDLGKCYFFQGSEGRIILANACKTDFTLIGATDRDHRADPSEARATEVEQDHLCRFASDYFEKPVARDDIV